MAECMAALLSLLPQQAMIAAWAISAWLAGLLAILPRRLCKVGQLLHARHLPAHNQQPAAKAQRAALAHGAHIGICAAPKEGAAQHCEYDAVHGPAPKRPGAARQRQAARQAPRCIPVV
jgi:hypothetical protein